MSVWVGGDAGDENFGTSDDDTLRGMGGDDTLGGGGGADRLFGGDGNDILDCQSDDSAVDTVSGGAGDDLLFGSVGDVLQGGDGGDIFVLNYANEGDTPLVLDMTGSTTEAGARIAYGGRVAGFERGTLSTGSANDHITIGDAHVQVSAGAGDDTVIGGADGDSIRLRGGNDFADGGAGFDRAGYGFASSGVQVSLLKQGAYQDTGADGLDMLVNFEALDGSNYADRLIGDDGVNLLDSGAGFEGSGNNDTLFGMGGDDLFSVFTGNHVVNGGSGVDTLTLVGAATIDLRLQGAVQTSGPATLVLRSIENLTGYVLDDQLIGDSKRNLLAGGGGSDTLSGNGGKDILYGDGAIRADLQNFAWSAAPATFQQSGAFQGADHLFGGAEADLLIGGFGADRLSGGSGGDVFRFLSLQDSLAGASDLILDLSDAEDRIDLSAIDAKAGKAGDQAFELVAALTGRAGEAALAYDKAADTTWLSLDVDGDGAADAVIGIAGKHAGFDGFIL